MTRRELEKLITVHGKSLYGFCVHLTGRKDAGEELFQETMLQALEHIGRIRATDDLVLARNYCMGIAVRQNRLRIRRESAHAEIPFAEDGDIGGNLSDLLAAEDRFIRIREMREVRSAVRALPEKQREAVILFYYSEMPVKEIAKTLRIPAGTVKSRLNSAKKALRKLLEDR